MSREVCRKKPGFARLCSTTAVSAVIVSAFCRCRLKAVSMTKTENSFGVSSISTRVACDSYVEAVLVNERYLPETISRKSTADPEITGEPWCLPASFRETSAGKRVHFDSCTVEKMDPCRSEKCAMNTAWLPLGHTSAELALRAEVRVATEPYARASSSSSSVRVIKEAELATERFPVLPCFIWLTAGVP